MVQLLLHYLHVRHHHRGTSVSPDHGHFNPKYFSRYNQEDEPLKPWGLLCYVSIDLPSSIIYLKVYLKGTPQFHGFDDVLS
jgi:hypothetical protein